MFDMTALDWPQVVVHIMPGTWFYGASCFVCGSQWVAMARPGLGELECPTCNCRQINVKFPMPVQAQGRDGVWIDPGTEPGMIFWN